jgi:hypothetical protein
MDAGHVIDRRAGGWPASCSDRSLDRALHSVDILRILETKEFTAVAGGLPSNLLIEDRRDTGCVDPEYALRG